MRNSPSATRATSCLLGVGRRRAPAPVVRVVAPVAGVPVVTVVVVRAVVVVARPLPRCEAVAQGDVVPAEGLLQCTLHRLGGVLAPFAEEDAAHGVRRVPGQVPLHDAQDHGADHEHDRREQPGVLEPGGAPLPGVSPSGHTPAAHLCAAGSLT
jgi:hypothetical protein